MNKHFYSCDWGTTKLRVRLVDSSSNKVISAIETNQGIAKTFSEWKNSGADRYTYYRAILQNCIATLKTPLQLATINIPVVVSGMATSNMGMIELPYAELPVKIDGTDLLIRSFQSSGDLIHSLLLISGVSTKNDLMRGEEIQVIGACTDISSDDALFILPGTHSKHVRTYGKNITDLKTFMTGEIFQLLSMNSILSGSVEFTDDPDTPGWENFFEEGIMQSLKNDLLENLFGLRVAHIFSKRTPLQNNYYLNGLLIGSELKNVLHDQPQDIVLISNNLQKKFYITALGFLKVRVRWISSEMATINGHSIIFQKYFN